MNARDEAAQHADFFQPGRTYVRSHHATTLTFRVRYTDRHPGGYPVAFGWMTDASGVTPYTSDDFTGWSEATP